MESKFDFEDDDIDSDIKITLYRILQEALNNTVKYAQATKVSILIKQGGIVTQTIDVSSASVIVNGTSVSINPADFNYNSAVNIEITTGAFRDLANNDYAGISDGSIWNFTTVDIPSGPQTLVAYGDNWKYLDNGSNQGTAWRAARTIHGTS